MQKRLHTVCSCETVRCVWGAEKGNRWGSKFVFITPLHQSWKENAQQRQILFHHIRNRAKDLAGWLYLVSHLFRCDVTRCFKTWENSFLLTVFCFKQTFELFCPPVRDVYKTTLSETSVGPTQLSRLSLTPAVSLAYIIAQFLLSSKKCTNTYWKIFLFFLPCVGSERTDSFIP